MKYVIQALRTTYYNEVRAYEGLRDLINLLEAMDGDDCHTYGVICDIEDLLTDIKKEDV